MASTSANNIVKTRGQKILKEERVLEKIQEQDVISAILAAARPVAAAGAVSAKVGDESKNRADPRIYIDITYSCFHRGQPFGILRVESGLAVELCGMGAAEPVAWNQQAKTFVKLPPRCLEDGSYHNYLQIIENQPASAAQLEHGAILLLPSYFWFDHPDYFDDLAATVKRKKLLLAPFIYDITWHKMAYTFTPEIVELYTTGVLKVIREAALIITTSHNSSRDIPEFCREKGINSPASVVCRLAGLPPGRQLRAPAGAGAWAKDPGFVLCVSTIAFHKNHKLLLALWRQLIMDYGGAQIPKLVCVGYPSNADAEFNNETTRDPVISGHIVLLSGLADEEMRWLYRNCLFTVFPSFYEGWGLPVGESIAHGKVCVASNAASIPEIAPEYTDLLHPRDFPGWYARLRDYILDPVLRLEREADIAAYRPATWRECANSFYGHLVEAAQALSPSAADCVKEGIIAPTLASQHLFKSGWLGIRDGAVRSRGKSARIIIFLPAGNEMHRVKFSWRCLNDEVQIALNGKLREVLKFDDSGWAEHGIIVPEVVPNRSGRKVLHIDFGPGNRPALDLELKYLCLEDMPSHLRPLDGDLAGIEKLHVPLAAGLRSIAQESGGLARVLGEAGGDFHILLWCWRTGIGVDNRIGRHWKSIRDILRKMGETSAAGAEIEGYSVLADYMAKTVRELRGIPADNVEGQKRILAWLKEYGIAQYNLRDIINI